MAHFRKVNYKTMTATMSVDAHQVNKSHTNPCCKLIITERLIQNKSGLAQCTCNMINEYCILYNAILLNHVSTFSAFLHHTVGVAHLSALPSAIHGLIHCLPVILHETTSYAASTWSFWQLQTTVTFRNNKTNILAQTQTPLPTYSHAYTHIHTHTHTHTHAHIHACLYTLVET